MWFSFDGETFETHETEAGAKAEADRAMEFWADNAGDGWDELSTQLCYGKITHAVRVEQIDVTDENRHLVPHGCEGLENHHLEMIDAGDQGDSMPLLPIDEMVKDACRLEEAIAGYEGEQNSLAADVCCHAKALAAEYERLRKDLAQKTAEHADVVRRKQRKDEEIERLRLFERAMESMAAQFICPRTTATELAQEQLKT